MPPISVEIDIRCGMEEVWARTRAAEAQERWDLRFTEIRPLENSTASEQRWLYIFRLMPGLRVVGQGVISTRFELDGSRTIGVKFWSVDSKSLVQEGAAYYRYIPFANGIRFCTWYDYTTRYGVSGRCFDTIVFRRVLGWVTAWSFDRLRLWLERGSEPETTCRRSLIHAGTRMFIAFFWLYHALFSTPFLIRVSPLVFNLAGHSALEALMRPTAFLEIAISVAILHSRHARYYLIGTALMLALDLVAVSTGWWDVPGSFNGSLGDNSVAKIAAITVCAVGLISGIGLPSVARCRRVTE